MRCGHCSGMMIPDPLDGGMVCSSCGRRTAKMLASNAARRRGGR